MSMMKSSVSTYQQLAKEFLVKTPKALYQKTPYKKTL